MQKLQPLKKSPIKFGHLLGASYVPINRCPSHGVPVIFAVSFLTGLAPTWSISSLWAREVLPLAPLAGATIDWYHLRMPVFLLEVMPLSAPWAASPQVLLWWGAQQESVETGVLPCSMTLAPWGHWGRGNCNIYLEAMWNNNFSFCPQRLKNSLLSWDDTISPAYCFCLALYLFFLKDTCLFCPTLPYSKK